MQTGISQPKAVHRVRSEMFEGKYLDREIPAIIIDALSDWKAVNAWSPEYLASVLKDKQTVIAVSTEDRFNYSSSENVDGDALQYQCETLDFIDAISKILNSNATDERYYVMQTSIPDKFPELLPDIKSPKWIESNEAAINLWFGTANNVTPLHYDQSNNFFAQVYGRKRVTLFDPLQTEFLYPYPMSSTMNHLSFVDIENPDLIRYPEYRKAQPMECILEPGELLYLPAYWWHQVRSLDVSISVSFWWLPDFQQFLTPNAIRALPLLYEKDHLIDVKKLLVSVGLDFLKAAMMLYSKNQRWAAILLAGAALEEFVRKLGRDYGLTEEAIDPSSPILLINSALQTANVYSWEDAKNVIGWIEMINQALTGDNDRFREADVVSLIDGISSFISSKEFNSVAQ
jgi:Cupin-like domain